MTTTTKLLDMPVHDERSLTPTGLALVLSTMHWADLEHFAEVLEGLRSRGVRSSRRITAQHIFDATEHLS